MVSEIRAKLEQTGPGRARPPEAKNQTNHETTGPEIVDKKLIHCKRVWNEKIQCVDFVEKENEKLVFRTYPKEEKSKLIFQLGTASPELAVEAAKVVAGDVDEIGVNSGCPKHFSIHSGMGAALLKTPDLLVSILRALVKEVGEPFNIPISVKIRILEDRDSTYELVRQITRTGIRCLSVHCRTTPMRPREKVIRDYLAGISDICHEAGVSCVVNGDVTGRYDLQPLIDKYKVDGAMIARGAESNASCFSATEPGPTGLQPWKTVAKEYIQICREFENPTSNSKFCVLKMIPGKDKLYQIITRAKTIEDIEQALNDTSTTTTTTNKRPRDEVVSDSPRKIAVNVA